MLASRAHVHGIQHAAKAGKNVLLCGALPVQLAQRLHFIIFLHGGLTCRLHRAAGRIRRIGGCGRNILQKFGKVFIHLRALPF